MWVADVSDVFRVSSVRGSPTHSEGRHARARRHPAQRTSIPEGAAHATGVVTAPRRRKRAPCTTPRRCECGLPPGHVRMPPYATVARRCARTREREREGERGHAHARTCVCAQPQLCVRTQVRGCVRAACLSWCDARLRAKLRMCVHTSARVWVCASARAEQRPKNRPR